MKKLFLVFGVLIGLLLMGNPSYALRATDSSNKTFLNSPLVSNNGASVVGAFIQTTGSSGTLMITPGVPITGIAISNGATAGVLSIYDASQAVATTGLAPGNGSLPYIPEVGALECVYETNVAASTGAYYDLSNAPINTVNGVVILTSGTVGAVVYTSNQINANH